MSGDKTFDIAPVLAVFQRFAFFEEQERLNKARGYIAAATSKIQLSYASKTPISLLLPAAPFKNSSPHKVLDTRSPDFGEFLGLSRLNHLCDDLRKVYPYGANLTMVSDGPVYNDLLCIPDADFYDYGIKLRKLVTENGFTRIRFRRLADVLGIADADSLSKAEYLALADTCRTEMEARFLPTSLQIEKKIESHKDTNLTYQAYVKLADEDLRWGLDLDPRIRDDRVLYTEETQKVAIRLTDRLLAYEGALEAAFPGHIRLSIHRSTGETKIPIPLIPQPEGFGLQPWHCCVVVTAQGQYLTRHSKDYRYNKDYEVVEKDGRPYLIRERHDNFDWPEHIRLHHTYEGGIVVENISSKDYELTAEWEVKLSNLALRFKSIELFQSHMIATCKGEVEEAACSVVGSTALGAFKLSHSLKVS
ncbi:Pyoverdine/dityrosine biosynthesis protein-domain-containing protein [Boeremia exigua]|uniref:Pyoverdine/dityrosine biosynthesis protein-domain-containing protein n=1 Tax=Boeremia exigua TaxID=749465 RepID=UPI001E8D358E|nr:Pyoverdine/dityrosine biosynthesis protein-domain-containing protein [Boeremia exigua]KAH6622476.1 Pyoverdine/dityrosine biosynthesis protein-domain-containing protein [Boeremia exigua]